MELRPDQEAIVHLLSEGYRSGYRRQLLQAPTGWGKTVLFSFVTKRAVSKGLRVMVCCHRREILAQISRTLGAVGVPHATIESGGRMFSKVRVQVASIPTLVRRFDVVEPPDLIVIDEAHHSVSMSWAAVFGQFSNAKVLGVTATPERLDGRGLGEFFDNLVLGPKYRDLISAGILAKPRYFAPSTVDCSGLHSVAGEFKSSESAELMDKPTITGDAIAHFKKFADGRKAVVFCVTVKHAEHTAEQFCKAGIPAVSIDGNLHHAERDRRLSLLASGEIRALMSCDLVSEGFDLPTVDAAVLLRPSKSLGLVRQQIGRALRMAPGKRDAIILDHVDNVRRHGPVEEEIEWTLEGGAAKRRKEKAFPTHQCPKCFAVFNGPACPECGQERESKPREIEHREGVLKELTPEDLKRRAARMEVGRAKDLEALEEIGRRRGYKPGWAKAVYAAKQRKMQERYESMAA